MKTHSLKVDLHMHSRGDPQDELRHGPEELIDAAAANGLDAIAISNHDCDIYCPALAAYARARGVLLIHGMELTYERQHILLINFKDVSDIQTPDDVYARKSAENLVIAAHPYFPLARSCGMLLDGRPELFDAVEYSFMYTAGINFANNRAVRRAAELGLPLVANSDAHSPARIGKNYTLVEVGEKSPEAIVAAVKAGRCTPVSTPMSLPGFFLYAAGTKSIDAVWKARRLVKRSLRKVFR